MTDSTLADDAVSFTDLIGHLASIGAQAQPFLDTIAPWVPIPYFDAAVHVLDVAGPYLAKISAAAPVVSQAINQDGRPAIDAVQAHAPELMDALKQVFAIATNADPARPAGMPAITAADVTTDQIAGYGAVIFTPGRTNAEQQREWDRAQGQA